MQKVTRRIDYDRDWPLMNSAPTDSAGVTLAAEGRFVKNVKRKNINYSAAPLGINGTLNIELYLIDDI